jgi:hypothetical protein
MLGAALRMCRGTPICDAGVREKTLRDFIIKLDGPIRQALEARELIRFEPCERDPVMPTITAIFDHTLVKIRNHDKRFFSGKHKDCGVKFCCTSTVQGTFITVLGPFDGSHHDFRTLQPDFHQFEFPNPLIEHYREDCTLCDLGYLGMRNHVIVPNKRLPRRELSDLQQTENTLIGRKRSRIEHSFSQLKGYWKLFHKQAACEPELLGTLFRLAVLAESIVSHKTNLVVPRYATKSRAVPPPIDVNKLTPCTCVWHERPEAEVRGGPRVARPMIDADA